MNHYQRCSNRIKPLTEILWDDVGAAERKEYENCEKLSIQFFEIFDELEGPEENIHHIQEIRAKIVRDMDTPIFDDIEVAAYTGDLLVYGFK